MWAGQRSRYSDLLRAGRSALFHAAQPDSYTMGTDRCVALTTHRHLAPRLTKGHSYTPALHAAL